MTTVVRNERDTFDVVEDDGETVRSGFITQADAWAWIDRQEQDALADEERRRRIQTAFAER